MEDEAIVSLYWARDEEAIVQTQQKYQSYLTTIAYNILADREDSRESVNDTYLAAWNSMPPHRPGVLSTYLGKLTRQLSIDRFRHRTRQKRGGSQYTLSLTELEDCLGAGDTTQEAVNAKLLADAIGIFLRLQSEEERNLFIGRYYFLDPLKEVAAYCGMTEARAKMLLYRTRLKLKDYLQKEGYAL